MTRQAGDRGTPRIQGLDGLIEAAGSERLPPVERWDPPYCGDIGMRIRADGTWLYQNSPIGRKALVKLFSRILRRDADGRTYLVTPVEKVDVTVDDAPFLAVEMQFENRGPGQQLVFRTNVDDIVRCGPDHPLRFARQAGSDGLKPYVLVRGRLEALLTRALYYDLVELAEPVAREGDQGLGIWSGGALFPIQAGTPGETAAHP
ncbi:MAG: DUF1285 domain-containing protein [Hyphomicrobiaceae bacterium]|nr:DUF1285 domain-containing protein [Hyphomicrobiaceae bacterium]